MQHRVTFQLLIASTCAVSLAFALGCSDDGGSPGAGGAPAQGGGAGGAVNASAGSSGGQGLPGGGVPPSAGGGGMGTGAGAGGQVGSGGTGGAQSAGGSGGQPATGDVAPVIAAGVRWFGRVDVSDPSAIKFAWSGSGFVGTFSGDKVSVKLRTVGNGEIYFQPVVDGTPGARFSVGGTEQVVDLATGLTPGEHRVELYRETEGKGFGYSMMSGFSTGTPAAPPAYSGRLIEVIGDSISAGYGNLGSEQHPNYGPDPGGGCHFTTETESAYQAYAHVAAREVDADASVLAGSGWGMYSDFSGNTANVMPALFGNTLGEQAAPAWSFAAKPQAVIINLGTNDSSAQNLTADKFKPAYAAFLDEVREKYPNALILGAVGSMLSGAARESAKTFIEELSAERAAQGDDKVKLLDLGTQDVLEGTGCDWHPSAAEDARMAALLVAELKASLDW